MSIYSGFATRQLEETYHHLLQDLLYVFQKRILKFYQNQQTDQQKFAHILHDIYTKLHQMEKHKYLQPNFSGSAVRLIKYFQKNGKLRREKDSIEKKSQKQKSQKQYQKCNKQGKQKQGKKNLWVKLPSKNQQNQKQKYQLDALSHRVGKIKHQSILKRELSAYEYQLNPQKSDKKIRSASTTLYAASSKDKHKLQINQRQNNKKIEKIPQKKQERSYKHLNFDNQDICNKKQYTVQSSRLSHPQVPQIVQQYIQQTNKNYMKSFRKRKIKLGSLKKVELD